MKRLLAAALAALLAFSLCSCAVPEQNEFEELEPEPQEETVQMVNPLEPCASLEELNERTGAKFYRTGDAEVTDEKYFIIGGETADYRFTVNGASYVWRFAKQTEMDISGVYTVSGTAFAEQLDKTELIFAEGDVLAARWCTDDGQYTISVEGGESEDEAFRAMATELSLVTKAK